MSQESTIAKHLLSGKSITPLEALNLYNVMRLAARVHDIRLKAGDGSVRSETVCTAGKHYSRYTGNQKALRRIYG